MGRKYCFLLVWEGNGKEMLSIIREGSGKEIMWIFHLGGEKEGNFPSHFFRKREIPLLPATKCTCIHNLTVACECRPPKYKVREI